MKCKLSVWLAGFFAILLSGVFVGLVKAERLESDSYVIQFGNFNITAGKKSSNNYAVTDTVGQTGAGPYGEYGVSNYFVGGGFQYIYQIDEFFFQISKLQIDLGTLSPGVHHTDSHTLRVSTRNGGYKVYAFEEHQLRHRTGLDEIADTLCDAGSCDEIAASIWQNLDIPGFGFNMSGDDVPIDFVNLDYFRQFANIATPEVMRVVMSADNHSVDRVATVTYKAGVAGDQAAGVYDTAVVFVAVPSY
ncbi:MAG: hypothetical protein COU66_03370 [Candidatus Pacebacteria bacterium CG10_big_fil_rev_8_21_14_0_10_44_11]|nr:MAG: hypothetical protein COU66_03370 [Candidatus Pacebacteria bacterium CG10_big_fil_rev_8_21_14_0_10_44_11]